ncbi:hypothetical protein COB52_02900 [Candidatus Kaiserbacteria bacterium]|nr:MAG: hypothetical protein COB52_02900 [Candidatus Kaiserbacteria bacterium]
MLNKMRGAGLAPKIISSFRSFNYQEDLKDRNVVTFGEGTANQFVADQGYSEHQLGTTIDIGTSADLLKFEPTDEYNWLVSNAYKHGFVLSYPENNDYYEFEPWHWRFVGISLATELKSQGKYFYDLSQREIDGFRLEMFND